jgi:glutathione S-transferase
MSIKLYHAPLTRSLRVRWLLEELGVDYELAQLDFMGGDLKKPDYLAKHPLGKVPTLEIDGITLWESGAMVEYLCEKYGKLAPLPGSPKRAEFLQWVHFSEATAMPPLGSFFQNAFIKPEAERIAAVVPEAKESVGKWLAVLDAHLKGRKYLLGDEFTAADVMMGYTVNGAKFGGILDARYPNVEAYLTRLSERPAFQKASS